MLGLFLLVWCSSAVADNPIEEQKPTAEFECRWAAEEFVIDGKADEPAWAAAQRIDHFYLPWLGDQSRSAQSATEARLLWNREYLYFFAELEDADVFADVKEHDGQTWDNDVFELFFKPADDKAGYYEFQVNAAATVFDMFWPRRDVSSFDRFKSEGEFQLESKVGLRGTLNQRHDKDEGWSVEGRIPWRDLVRTGGRPVVDEVWRFALCRYNYSNNIKEPELSTCAPLKDRRDFHDYENYAKLRFIGPKVKSDATLPDLKPYAVTSRVSGSPEPPPPYRTMRVLPKLRLSWPIFAVVEPGSTRLWFIDETGPNKPARVARTFDDPTKGEFETLINYDGIAYDIAFHPDFLRNGYVFMGVNAAFGEPAKKTRIIRYTVDRQPPYQFHSDSAKSIIEWPSDGHNGGAIAFGKDGMLYVTSGDSTSDSDGNLVGQDLAELTAKVLRIDIDHPHEGQGYSVPKDNPFLKMKDARPETWAYGLRNPWRISIDPRTGHVWVGDNGQDLWEMAYLIERGANYGWSVFEGSHPFYPDRKLGPTPVSKPTVEHHHSEFRSLTGGIVYYGKRLPELQGAYVYGDYSTGKIWGAKHDGEKLIWHKELADTTLQITAFARDNDGELLIADHQGNERGGFYTLEPNPDDESQANFPRRLSDSGLFRSVSKHEVQAGMIPYSVNSPLWSDNAHKERFLALPPSMIDDDEEMPAAISVTSGAWSFPDQTVLIKSFALDLKEGEPDSRRWIETRFLTKQQGEWVGYSFEWNAEQSDATLVDKAGQDREFAIDTNNGKRKQLWHFPSRTECMVCHSRAANFVLGMTTPQMNRLHDYGGGCVENQLSMLERLGVLRVNWRDEAIEALRNELTEKGLDVAEVERQISELTAIRDQRTAPPAALLFQAADKYDCLADPYDNAQPLEQRARSYLQVNCAQCHILSGGGNAQFDASITTPLAKANLIDAKPLHHTFDINNPRLIAPGDPERSVLLRRISHREPGHMPPLATSEVDRRAVELIRQWIVNMPPSKETP